MQLLPRFLLTSPICRTSGTSRNPHAPSPWAGSRWRKLKRRPCSSYGCSSAPRKLRTPPHKVPAPQGQQASGQSAGSGSASQTQTHQPLVPASTAQAGVGNESHVVSMTGLHVTALAAQTQVGLPPLPGNPGLLLVPGVVPQLAPGVVLQRRCLRPQATTLAVHPLFRVRATLLWLVLLVTRAPPPQLQLRWARPLGVNHRLPGNPQTQPEAGVGTPHARLLTPHPHPH